MRIVIYTLIFVFNLDPSLLMAKVDLRNIPSYRIKESISLPDADILFKEGRIHHIVMKSEIISIRYNDGKPIAPCKIGQKIVNCSVAIKKANEAKPAPIRDTYTFNYYETGYVKEPCLKNAKKIPCQEALKATQKVQDEARDLYRNVLKLYAETGNNIMDCSEFKDAGQRSLCENLPNIHTAKCPYPLKPNLYMIIENQKCTPFQIPSNSSLTKEYSYPAKKAPNDRVLATETGKAE